MAEALPGDKAVQRDLAEMSKALEEENAAGFLGFDVATNPLFRWGVGPGKGGREAGRHANKAHTVLYTIYDILCTILVIERCCCLPSTALCESALLLLLLLLLKACDYVPCFQLPAARPRSPLNDAGH